MDTSVTERRIRWASLLVVAASGATQLFLFVHP